MQRSTLRLTAVAMIIVFAVGERASRVEADSPPSPGAIALEVLIVRTNLPHDQKVELLLPGPAAELTARLSDLEKKGQILDVDRFSLSLLEKEQAKIQMGKTVPVVRATNFVTPRGAQVPPSFRGQVNYSYENVGTLVAAWAEIRGDEVMVKLSVEQSQLVPQTAPTNSDDGIGPPRTDTLSSEIKCRLEPGQTTLVGGLESREGPATMGQFILASARILKRPPNSKPVAEPAEERQTKVFSLRHANAHDVAETIHLLVGGDAERFRFAVDARTNSLIVSSGDEHQLDLIEALLFQLDSSDSRQAGEVEDVEVEPEKSPAPTTLDTLERQELESEVRRLQSETTEAEASLRQAMERARAAADAYKVAVEEAKPDALLRMIEADVASRQPQEHYRDVRRAFDNAKQALIRRLLAESQRP